jgi:hypothetical protein
MAGTETQIAAVELERVAGDVPTLFERDDTFFSQIEKRPVEVISPRDMRIPLEIRPGGKTRHWDPEGGDMGRGDTPTFDKAVINTVHLLHAVEYTVKAKWATDDKRKAVLNAVQRNVASAMKEFRRNIDSLCMTPGTGVLGTISAVSTASGVDTYTLGSDGYGARLLRYGMDINVYSSDLSTNLTAGSERTITFHDGANKQIKVAAVTGVQAGMKIVASGLSATPPVSILGVPYHHSNASTGYWLGFDRSTNPEIRSNRVAAGGSLTLPFPRLAINKIGDRVGISKRKKKLQAWTHPCQQQAYEEMGFDQIVIQKAAKEEGLDLYFNDNMRIAGAPIHVHYSWDKTRIDFVDMDVWGRAEFHAPGFFRDDNGNIYFVIRGASGGVAGASVFYLVCSFNLFINNPPATAYIDTLTVPSGY